MPRRLMYWQVYLHKTTVSAERMLVNLIRRAQALVRAGETLPASDALSLFLEKNLTLHDFKENDKLLENFGHLDDNDIWGAMKFWKNHRDNILSLLSTMMLERKLFKIRLSAEPIKKDRGRKDPGCQSQKHITLYGQKPLIFFLMAQSPTKHMQKDSRLIS